MPVELNDAGPDESSAAAATGAAEVVWTPTLVTSTAETAVATRAGISFTCTLSDRRLPPHTH